MSDIQRYAPWPQEWPQEDPDGDLVEYEDHKKIVDALQARAERLEAAVIAAAKIGQIVGFLGEDEGRIEAFREACGPELWAKARAALKGDDHE